MRTHAFFFFVANAIVLSRFIRGHWTMCWQGGWVCACAQNRDILFVFSQIIYIVHHRLSNIIVQLGKVVLNCTRYTSSQKIRTKSDGSSWKHEKLNVANVNKEKHGGNYEIGIWQLADKEGVCVGEFILSPHSSAVHYAEFNHRSITDNCWTSYWSK
jgi:hypothetical protein